MSGIQLITIGNVDITDQKYRNGSLKSPELIKFEYELICELVKSRKEKSLTQRNLAEILGFRQQNISMIENQHVSPSLSTILRIADVLDLKLIFVSKT